MYLQVLDYSNIIMVKWSDSWLGLIDKNNVKIQLWANKYDNEYALCTLCSSKLKYSGEGVQALLQHSTNPKHKSVSDGKFSKTQVHIIASKNNEEAPRKGIITLDPSENDKITSAEARWMFKVAAGDYSLNSCENTPVLFQRMFPDSSICEKFTMSKQKASYIASSGLGPLMAKQLCKSVSESGGAFTMMFDETTTLQNRKQMDLILRFWSESEKQVVTKYLMSLFFARAPAEKIVTMLTELLQENRAYQLPWDRLFNISSDGPNINRSIWKLLHSALQEKSFYGLLPFLACTMRFMQVLKA